MRSNRSRRGTKRCWHSLIGFACVFALGASIAAPARAAWITATFPAVVYAATDSSDLLGLGAGIAPGDNLIVSIFIDTQWIDMTDTATGAGALSVTVTDSNTGRTAIFTDTGDPGGLFGTGSFFIPNTGTYYIEGHGGRVASILLTLSLDDGAVIPALVEQLFTVSPGSGSGGTLQAYLTDSLTASVGFDFTQGDIDVPEPSGLALLCGGLLSLAAWRHRRLFPLQRRAARFADA